MGVCMGKDNGGVVHSPSTKKSESQQKVLAERSYKAKNVNQMSEQDKATIQLKQVQDQLNKRMQQIEKGMNDADAEAKTYIRSGNKQRARFALERKQLYTKYEENVLNQDRAINKTLRDIQEAFDNAATAQTLKNANKLMVDINKAIDMDAMHDAAENLQELETNNKEFTQLYSQYVGADSEEVMKEVDRLEAELFKSQINKHDENTQKPILQQKHQYNNDEPMRSHQPQQQQQQQRQQQPQQQQFHNGSESKNKQAGNQPKDELDQQLEMLL